MTTLPIFLPILGMREGFNTDKKFQEKTSSVLVKEHFIKKLSRSTARQTYSTEVAWEDQALKSLSPSCTIQHRLHSLLFNFNYCLMDILKHINYIQFAATK